MPAGAARRETRIAERLDRDDLLLNGLLPGLLVRFAVDGKIPRTVLLIHSDAACFHFSKAIVRSRFRDPDARIERDRLPSAGAMHRRLSGATFDEDSYDRDLPARTVAGLY